MTKAIDHHNPDEQAEEIIQVIRADRARKLPHLEFRRKAFELAMTLDPTEFVGEFDAPDHETVEGLARTLAIIAGGYDFQTDENGKVYCIVAGDQGGTAVGLTVWIPGMDPAMHPLA